MALGSIGLSLVICDAAYSYISRRRACFRFPSSATTGWCYLADAKPALSTGLVRLRAPPLVVLSRTGIRGVCMYFVRSVCTYYPSIGWMMHLHMCSTSYIRWISSHPKIPATISNPTYVPIRRTARTGARAVKTALGEKTAGAKTASWGRSIVHFRADSHEMAWGEIDMSQQSVQRWTSPGCFHVLRPGPAGPAARLRFSLLERPGIGT